jgi:hypothetical protein
VAYLVSLADLALRVREEADMEGDQFVSDALLERWLYQEIADLYDRVLEMHGPDLLRQTTTYTSDGLTNVYSLPSDYYRLLLVAAKVGGYWQNLLPMGAGDVPDQLNSAVYGDQCVQYYRLGRANLTAPTLSLGGATTLEVWPQHAAGIPLRVDYVPVVKTWSNVVDVVNAGWEMYPVYKVAARCLAKEESDPTYCLTMAADQLARIKAAAVQIDSGEPRRIRDVQGDDDRDYDGWWGRFRW